MSIKAIETKYKGYRFRSRLEARWAVFFDALQVPYKYEPEGYELPSGRYLPDFFLPNENSFIEVKPGPAPAFRFYAFPWRREIQLVWELSEAKKCSAYVVYDDPLSALAADYPGLIEFEYDNGWSLSFLYLKRELITPAGIKARQARFEHGEAGAPA